MERKYRAMQIMVATYRILGVITAILTIASAIGFCVLGFLGNATLDFFLALMGIAGTKVWQILAGGLLGVLTAISGGAMTVTFFGLADGFSLLMALEENTRVAAQLLHRQSSR